MYNYLNNINPKPLTNSIGGLHELEAIYTGVPRPRVFDMENKIPMFEKFDFQAKPLIVATPRINAYNHEFNCIPLGFAIDQLLTPAMLIQNSPAVTLGPAPDASGMCIYSRFRNFKLVNVEVVCYPNANMNYSGEWAMQLVPILTYHEPRQLAMNTQFLFPGDYLSEPLSYISSEPTPGKMTFTPDDTMLIGRFQHPEEPIMRFRFSTQIVRDFVEGHGYLRLLDRSFYNFRFTIKTKWIISGFSNFVTHYAVNSTQYGPYKQAGLKTKNWSNSNERYHVFSYYDVGNGEHPFALWHVNNGEWEYNNFNGFVKRTNTLLGPILSTQREMVEHEQEDTEEEDGFVML